MRLAVDTPAGVGVALGAALGAAGAKLAADTASAGPAARVNGLPRALSWRADGSPLSVLAFTVVDGRITAITAVVDPAKLALADLPDPA